MDMPEEAKREIRRRRASEKLAGGVLFGGCGEGGGEHELNQRHIKGQDT